MKTIVAEYPIEIVETRTNPTIYRFSTPIKPFNPESIKYKPLSGYTEVSIPFPLKNTSALKLKSLNASQLTFKAFPEHPQNYFWAKIKDGKLILSRVSNLYLFEAMHQYYNVEVQTQKLKKAESREELEHKRKSINFKLKIIDNEDFRTLEYDSNYIQDDDRFIQKTTENIQIESNKENDVKIEALAEEFDSKFDQALNEIISTNNSENQPVNFSKIESTIKNARIVNFSNLVNIFKNKSAITSVLYKMTTSVAGRFVLKTQYYEKRLWDLRNRLIELFKRKGEVNISETVFLGDEQWLAQEISDEVDRKYVLKGFKEALEFDAENIYNSNVNLVKQILRSDRILSSKLISEKLSIDEEIISNILKSNNFIHLINNSYALNDEEYWFTCVLKLFETKKTVDISDIQNTLTSEGIEKSSEEILAELKLFCNHRNTKYTLKTQKE